MRRMQLWRYLADDARSRWCPRFTAQPGSARLSLQPVVNLRSFPQHANFALSHPNIVPRRSRPALIIVEPNPGEALSVRKLAVETAKFNVLTAHSAEEGIETLDRFPNADGI